MKKLKKGFTLTEVLLVLAIAAIIIASVFLIYRKVSAKSEANMVITVLNDVSNNINTLFSTGGVGDSQGLNDSQLNYLYGGDFSSGLTTFDSLSSKGYERPGLTLLTESNFNVGGDGNSKILSFIIIVSPDICPTVAQAVMAQGTFMMSLGSNYYANSEAVGLKILTDQGININNNPKPSDLVTDCVASENSVIQGSVAITMYKIV